MIIPDGEPVRSSEPSDRLTRIADAMFDAMTAHPEHTPDVRCLLLINDPSYGGVAMTGYADSDDVEAITDILVHLAAVLRTHGKALSIIPFVPGQG